MEKSDISNIGQYSIGLNNHKEVANEVLATLETNIAIATTHHIIHKTLVALESVIQGQNTSKLLSRYELVDQGSITL